MGVNIWEEARQRALAIGRGSKSDHMSAQFCAMRETRDAYLAILDVDRIRRTWPAPDFLKHFASVHAALWHEQMYELRMQEAEALVRVANEHMIVSCEALEELPGEWVDLLA